MRIYKDKKTGIYHADYIVRGVRVRPSLHTRNSQIATINATKLINRQNIIAGNLDLINYKYTDFLDKFLFDLKCSSKTKNTFSYAGHLLVDFISPSNNNKKIIFLADVNPSALNDLCDFLCNKYPGQNAGINRNIRAIKTMMRRAEKVLGLPKQQWEDVKKLKEKKGRLEFHSAEEIKIILSVMPTLDYKLTVSLGARAGLRRGEIAVLKWQDVDFANNRLYIAPNKTENGRYVPMTTDLKDLLLQAKKHQKNEFVINCRKEYSRTSKDFLTAMYSKLTKSLPCHCTLHKLRHTFASHLVQNGIDLYTVSKLLGHSTIAMTEIYAHLAPDTFAAAINKLPKI